MSEGGAFSPLSPREARGGVGMWGDNAQCPRRGDSHGVSDASQTRPEVNAQLHSPRQEPGRPYCQTSVGGCPCHKPSPSLIPEDRSVTRTHTNPCLPDSGQAQASCRFCLSHAGLRGSEPLPGVLAPIGPPAPSGARPPQLPLPLPRLSEGLAHVLWGGPGST